MEKEVITTYCIINDTLKIVGIKDEPQAKMSSSEILTTATIACMYFGGNFILCLIIVLIVASNRGYIREFLITPGSVHDIQELYGLPLNIEEYSILQAYRGYNDYLAENLLNEIEGIK